MELLIKNITNRDAIIFLHFIVLRKQYAILIFHEYY